MKYRLAATLTLLVTLLGACTRPDSGAPQPLSSAQSSAIHDSVAKLVEGWRAAVISLDTTGLAAFYSTDPAFRWIEDGRIRYLTAGELLGAWRATVPGVKAMDLVLDQTEIVPLAPGVASVTTSFTQKVTDTAGRQGGFAGATSLIAVQTAAGWRFLMGHTSAAGDPSPPTPSGP